MTPYPEPRQSALAPVQPEPGMLVHSRADGEAAVADWLLAAADNRAQGVAEWARTGLTLLRCGTLFAAVRIDRHLANAAAQTTDPRLVDAFLARVLDGGPVIHDRRAHNMYALVPASTADRWQVSGTTCLSRGSHLGVPHPSRTEPEPHRRAYWSVPMPSPGELCTPRHVSRLVHAGYDQQAQGTA